MPPKLEPMRNVVQLVREALVENFREIDRWFDKDHSLLHFKPTLDHWNAREVLEHISLANYFLLLIISKSTRRALDRRVDGLIVMPPANYEEKFREIDVISDGDFQWVRPEHMEPTGLKAMSEVRTLLKQQYAQCMYNLSLLKNGEGRLVSINMSVNNLGKIDVYQYIYFLTMHIQRHVGQMQKLEMQYEETEAMAS